MNKYFWSLALLIIMSSCAKKLSLFNPNPDKFNLNNLEYEYIATKSKVRFEDNGKKQKAIANIRLKKDSILWFSVTPGMGIEAARGVVTQDEFIIIDRIHRSYVRRPISEFSDKAHFDLDLSLLESILVGNMIWPVEKKGEISKEDDFYIVSKEKGDLQIENYIGTNSMKLEKVHAMSDTTSSTLDILYKDFQKFSGHVVPSKVDAKISYKVLNRQKMSNITIEHTKVDIDQGTLTFPFSIPRKYKAK
ncbi:DUF4292 domain-containing protein [Reichenbachiella versicolor]|uniref:DUF4292 domain-containing protein n=1 Tax=Reichenbachiella versicolor TaxID=1821036 RepID=UPI000D6E988E|nr:DUF4292 domain-containing protein [Reichenbachiella versicolor]